MYQVQSPILFLIFNRPDVTKQVFEVIKKVKPPKLYIGADGPRNNNNDLINCKKCLEIINEVDWNCEIKTLINNNNLGCKLSVSNSINWFFENEKEGIILEDDCFPSIDFFRFCDELLEKYRYDNRIGHITGSNFQNDKIRRGGADYYFSRHPIVWGWASWSRVWKDYDINMSKLDSLIETDSATVLSNNKRVRKNIYNNFRRTQNNEINTWDYQYFYSLLLNGYMSIIPNYNLISNIGFGDQATHTFNTNSERALKELELLPEILNHPEIFLPNFIADNYSFNRENPNFIKRVIKKIF